MTHSDQSTRVYADGEVIKTYDLPYYYEPEVELLTGGGNVLLVASDDPEILGTLLGWCRLNNFYLYQAVRNSVDMVAIPCAAEILDSRYIGSADWQFYQDHIRGLRETTALLTPHKDIAAFIAKHPNYSYDEQSGRIVVENEMTIAEESELKRIFTDSADHHEIDMVMLYSNDLSFREPTPMFQIDLHEPKELPQKLAEFLNNQI